MEVYYTGKIAHAVSMALYEPVSVYNTEKILDSMGSKLSEAMSGIDSMHPVSGSALQFDPYIGAVVIGTIGTVAAISYAINRSLRHLPRY